jgi:hypothetical protein
MRPVVLGVVGVTAVLLAGCAGTTASRSPSSDAPASSPPSAPIASPGVTAPPASSAAGAAAVTNGPLDAGRYTSTSLGVTIEFEISEPGWSGADDIPDVGLALLKDGIEGGVSITHFDGDVFSEPCSPQGLESIDPSAQSFIAWLVDHPELDAQAPADVTLGGLPAVQVDVSSGVGEECPDGPRVWLWVLPVVGDFHLDEGEAARFVATDAGAETIVVVIEAFDPTDIDALLEATEPILASLTIQP